MNLDNYHPVDRLALIRDQIKQLQELEKAAKDEVSAAMGSADSIGGDMYIAKQTITERKGSIDTKAMEAAGIDPEKFRKPSSTVLTIRTEQRAQIAA